MANINTTSRKKNIIKTKGQFSKFPQSASVWETQTYRKDKQKWESYKIQCYPQKWLERHNISPNILCWISSDDRRLWLIYKEEHEKVFAPQLSRIENLTSA